MLASQHADLTEALQAENERLRARVAALEAAHSAPAGSIFDMLKRAARSVTSGLDFERWLDIILTHTAALAGTPHAYSYLLDDDGTTIQTRAAIGLFEPFLGRHIGTTRNIAHQTTATAHVWRTGEPLVVEDYVHSPYYQTRWEGAFSTLAVLPIQVGTQVAGVLGIAHTEEGQHFTPVTTALMAACADMIAIGLYNFRLYDELQRSQAFANQITQMLPDALYLSDLTERRLTAINDKVEGILGINGEALSQASIAQLIDLVHPDDRDMVSNLMAALTDQPDSTAREFEIRLRHMDGHYHWVRSRVAPFSRDDTGRVTQILGVLHDIAERKQAEQAFRASEARFRAIMDMVNVIVFIVQDQQAVYVNPSAERIHGYTSDELREGGFWGIFHPDSLEEVRHHKAAYAQTGVIVPQVEARIYTRAGALRWLDVRLAQIEWEGRPALMGTAMDITERKEMQRQELAQRLESERSQLLSNFIQGVSHDFRTPITIINTGLYLLERTTDPERRVQRIEIMQEQTAILERLISRSLTIIDLDNAQQIRLQRTEMIPLLNIVAEDVKKLSRQHQIELLADIPLSLPMIDADPARLDMALTNLLENAILYTPQGGRVLLQAWHEADDHLVIQISDTGIGIHEDDLPRIFERLYRVDQSRPMGGVGLGLPIAQRIVHLHGGTLTVSSTLGVGSTFTVALPVAPPR